MTKLVSPGFLHCSINITNGDNSMSVCGFISVGQK